MKGSENGISFVVPVFNEAGALEQSLTRLSGELTKTDHPFEIIVVDDCSTDDSGTIAANCKGVRVVRHPVNSGYGRAIKSGIAVAKYPWIGIVDADGTYDIERLGELVAKMDEGFDMVVAARQNVLAMDRPLKRFFRRLLIGFLGLVVNKKIEDPNSGFRIFKKDLAVLFMPFLCNTFSFTTSLTVFAFGEAFFVEYVPMEYTKRTGKTKVRHVRDSIRMIQMVLQGISFFNPLKLFILLIVFSVVFVGFPAMVIAMIGWLTLSLYFLVIGTTAMLLFGLGIIGDIIRVSGMGHADRKINLAALRDDN